MAKATYTHGHHESVLRSHQWRTAANSAAYLIEHLRPGDSLLDVGCGPGTITMDLAILVHPGHVTAIDNAPEVVETARRSAQKLTTGPDNIVWEVADVHALPYPDNSFDVVHAHQVLQHVADPVAALREMRRVCRPGGIVAVRDCDYAAMVWYPDPPGMREWVTLYRRLIRANGGEPDAGRRLLSWAQQAGFTQITPTASTWCFATPEERAWWSQMWADRVIESEIATGALTHGYATRQDLEHIAEGWRTWGSAPDGWFSVLHSELICRV